jgi:hypothetical protein
MTIPGIENQKIEMKILDFEEDDKTWFLMSFNVKSKQGSWEIKDHSLQVYEVMKIIDWFRDWAENKPNPPTELVFLEPVLFFEVLKNDAFEKLIRIKFEFELKPQFISRDVDCFVDCALTNEHLLELSNTLSEELSKFPSCY